MSPFENLFFLWFHFYKISTSTLCKVWVKKPVDKWNLLFLPPLICHKFVLVVNSCSNRDKMTLNSHCWPRIRTLRRCQAVFPIPKTLASFENCLEDSSVSTYSYWNWFDIINNVNLRSRSGNSFLESEAKRCICSIAERGAALISSKIHYYGNKRTPIAIIFVRYGDVPRDHLKHSCSWEDISFTKLIRFVSFV